LALAAALLITMLVFIPATDAADRITIETDGGVILLSTGPDVDDNWIRYFENPLPGFDVDDPDYEQFIEVSKCGVTTPTGDDDEASLLIIEPSPQYRNDAGLGLVSNGFGVRTKNNCATSNGQIDTAQSLTFSLGSSFGSTYAIDRIEVDVEGKQNAELEYSLDYGEGTGTKTLNSASDNGADAGVGDNLVVVIPDAATVGSAEPFTSVTFSPTPDNDKALVSIEGGGDGAAPIETGGSRLYEGVTQTLFRIVPSLLCGDDRAPTSIDEDGPALDALVTRGSDLKSTDPCVPVPYVFEIQDDSVYFDYLDNGDGAQFVVRIDWDPSDPIVNPLVPPVRQINWTDDSDANYEYGVACLYLDDSGTPVHPPDPDAEPPDPDAENDKTVPWCLIEQTLQLTEKGWQQIQRWHGQGDPRWR